jgi:SAM-dependent methyltransferase
MPGAIILMLIVFVLGLQSGRLSNALAQTAAGHTQVQGVTDHSDRGYQHSFEHAETWAEQFDDPARDTWQKPDEVLDALHFGPSARIADLGAGTGYFSVRIAKRIPEGKLFAVDIEPDMLRHVRERAHREHLSVLVPIQASAETPNLPEVVDLVLVVDTYHHIDNRVTYFAKLRESLRLNGRVAIVDFKADTPEGPPLEHRIPPEKVIAELSAAGYSLVAAHQFLPRQYFLVFEGKTS